MYLWFGNNNMPGKAKRFPISNSYKLCPGNTPKLHSSFLPNENCANKNHKFISQILKTPEVNGQRISTK